MKIYIISIRLKLKNTRKKVEFQIKINKIYQFCYIYSYSF